MSKELPQRLETNIPNRTTLEKARQMWELLRRNSLTTVAVFMAVGSASIGWNNTVDQKPDLIETPSSSVYKLPEGMPSLTIKLTDSRELNSPSTISTAPTAAPETDASQEEKPKFSVRHLNGGETADFDSNVIVAGDVSVNGKRFYDDDSETGLIVSLPEGGRVLAPFGSDVLIPTSQEDTNAIIEQKKQEMIESGCGNKCSKGVVVRTITKADTADPTPPPSATPVEVPKTYLRPGESRYWTQLVEVTSGQNEEKAIHAPLKGGNRGNVNIAFRISSDPQTIYHEGDLIVFKRTAIVTAIMTARRGAGPGSDPTVSETCFEEIGFNVYSRKTGWTDKPIVQATLDKNICIPRTVYGFFFRHDFDGKSTVRSTFYFVNSSPEADQRATVSVDESNCFPYSDRQFHDEKGTTSPGTPRTIPRNGGVAVRMESTLPANADTTSFNCSATVQAILED